MKSKIAMGIYFLILVMIVYAANQGTLPNYISFYREIPFGDALGHFILMGILSFLATIISQGHRVFISRITIPLGPMIVFLIVFMEELSQMFIPTRTFSFNDLLADILGIAIFAWLGLRLLKRTAGKTADKVIIGNIR